MKLLDIPEKYAFIILRSLMGIIFVTHGAARLVYWTVPGFGSYLDAQGFPFGILLAWLVTVGELISGTLLAVGYKVKYCVLFHSIVIITGIFLIHLPNGWFTVGQSLGGVEYSLLILAVLVYIYSRSGRK
jgi:putative oxidoreductase